LKFPLYIARRYLFAKKKRNAINIITLIAVFEIMVVSSALVVVLSVFNGFDGLIQYLFSTFDPDLKITPVMGKVFSVDNEKIQKVFVHPGIEEVSEVLEENALITFEDKQYPATIKGVSENFAKVSGIDSMLVEGKFILQDKNRPYAIIGQGLAYYLSYNSDFVQPLNIYMIKRTGRVTLNAAQAVKRKPIYTSGVFRIEQSYDIKYMIVSLSLVRELLDYNTEVSALEIKLKEGVNREKVQNEIKEILGDGFYVKNRYQQNEAFYKIMKTEKWAIYFIVLFILIIVSFNVLGSLAMLVLDKKEDIATLQSMGASQKLIKRIFVTEGGIISFFGAILGLLLGLFICWLQIKFGLVQLKGSGSFIIDSYPVMIKSFDLVLVFTTVLAIGFSASMLLIHYMERKYRL